MAAPQLPHVATLRGTEEYRLALQALAEAAGYRTVADLIDDGISQIAKANKITLPKRWDRLATGRRKADDAPPEPAPQSKTRAPRKARAKKTHIITEAS